MSDEQRRVALLQAHPKGTSFGAQPEGLGLFLHPAALSFAHVAGLHHAHSALLGTKTAPAGRIGLVLTGPKGIPESGMPLENTPDKKVSRWKEDIQSVFERDPAARNTFEILISYPGVHAIIFHRLSHKLWNFGLKTIARLFSNLGRWLTGIEIHPGAVIGRRFFIDHGMGVVIGETAVIGDDCTLYHGVTLGGTSWEKGKRHPTLSDNVVVGAGAKVLGPILIGEGARIGSNSVVVKDVPAGATVVGVPGKLITARQQEESGHREAIAKKIGFDAYGATKDAPDPVAQAINCMLDHMHVMDSKMQSMCEALKRMGVEETDEELPTLDSCEIISTAEELQKIEEQITGEEKTSE